MIGNINRIFKIEDFGQPEWYYYLIYLSVGLIVVVSILLTIAMYLHKFQIKTDVERVDFCKKTVLAYIIFMLVTFSFFSLVLLMEIISISLNYFQYWGLYYILILIGTLIIVIIGLPFFIIGTHALRFFINLEKSKTKALISSFLYLHVIVLFASFLTTIFVYPDVEIGKNGDSGIFWIGEDSIISLTLSILAIVIFSIPFIILNRKNISINEGMKTSYPLKIFSQYFLLILALMKIVCFICGVIYMRNLPYGSTSYGPAILMYSYIGIIALINLTYLSLYIEILQNFRLLDTHLILEEMNLNKNNPKDKMGEFEEMETTL